MRSLQTSWSSICLVLILVTVVSAAVPTSINVQGRLTDASGTPIGERELRFGFHIFDAQVDGAEFWPRAGENGELQVIMPDANGLWNAAIGLEYPILPEVFSKRSESDDSTRWLQITVDGEPLPRIRLITVPYAMKVGSIDGALGGDVFGNITLHSQFKVGDESGDAGRIKITDGAATTITLEGTTGDMSATGKATIGPLNTNTGSYGFVAGYDNTVSSNNATVGGGNNNVASGSGATVSGGSVNVATAEGATIAGGFSNFANGRFSVVGGGGSNRADTMGAVVAGGYLNVARGAYSVIGGGGSGLVADSNSTHGKNSVIAGGAGNFAGSDYAAVGGGKLNAVKNISTSAKIADYGTVAGGHNNRVTDSAGTICGGAGNTVKWYYGAVAGGRDNECDGQFGAIGGGDSNTVSGKWATVAGGFNNWVNAAGCAIGGGRDNYSFGTYTTIGGGNNNRATGGAATIGGGTDNVASGAISVVPGGLLNRAEGNRSFAAGQRAHAMHDGSVVIAANANSSASASDSISSSANEQMVLRADGHFYLTDENGDATIPSSDFLNTSTGAHLTTGGVWTNSCDVNAKENFRPVDAAAVLDLIARLPISEWNYITEDDGIRHIGPTAQDFHALFDLGTDNKSISTIDPAGIALAAIQELIRQNSVLNSVVADQQRQIDELRGSFERDSAHQ